MDVRPERTTQPSDHDEVRSAASRSEDGREEQHWMRTLAGDDNEEKNDDLEYAQGLGFVINCSRPETTHETRTFIRYTPSLGVNPCKRVTKTITRMKSFRMVYHVQSSIDSPAMAIPRSFHRVAVAPAASSILRSVRQMSLSNQASASEVRT